MSKTSERALHCLHVGHELLVHDISQPTSDLLVQAVPFSSDLKGLFHQAVPLIKVVLRDDGVTIALAMMKCIGMLLCQHLYR